MKTTIISKLDYIHKVSLVTLALLAASNLAARAADIQWIGGTASYTNAAAWGGNVPGILDSAINDNGLGNAVQINVGDPDWTVGQIRAGNSAGDGSFVQNGQTVTALGTNYNGPVITEFTTPFRLGIVAADTGVYTLNGGSLNYGSGPFTIGAVGTGILNINGGAIAGSGVFAVNYGGISTPNPAVLTATAGHGPYLGDYTYFEQGYYTPNTTVGLPAAGSTVVSIGSPDHSYTMAPTYTAPNAVIVDAAVPNATITLGTPTVCSGLSFMASCGDGPVNVNYTVNHSSGTPETGTLVVQDWFFPQAPQPAKEILAANGRCNGLGRDVQITGNVAGYTGNPPYMWSLDVPVSNPNPVTSISLTFVSGGSTYATATILGVSAQSAVAGPFAPLAITGYNYDVVVENGAPSPNVSPSITDIVNQTNGAVNVSGELWVGNGGVGIYNFTNGSINASNWVNIGRFGGTGTLNMAGGTINKSGSAFVVGANAANNTAGAVGTANQSAGTINSSSEVWIGQANNNPGLGTGTYNLSGTAALNVTNWLAIGREGGLGVLNMSGGSITKTGNGNLTMTHGTGAAATINQTGGSMTLASGEAWIGEDGGSATWNMNGGTANVGLVHISQNASASGTLNVNGGIFSAAELTTGNSGAVSTLNLNGGVVRASGNNLNFLHDIFVVQLQAGGAIFDSAGFNITIPQALPNNGDGSGGLTKTGSGVLTLTGANTYAGLTRVSAGTLAISTSAGGGGDYTVADGGDLSLTVASANAQLNVANLTLGASTGATLDFDLGGFGNPVSAPINVVNALTNNGVTTVNLTDALPQLGQFPLIKYGSKTGSGGYVVGSIPVGVGAYISNNVLTSSIDVVITNVNLPRWEGLAGGNWDIGVTTNWLNIGNGLPTFFAQGNVVAFNDSALGTTTVNLATTVNPGGITVNNNSLLYTLVGTGKISGNVGITKQGASSLTIANTGGNNFTGPLVISGGTVSVTNLANGGSPSAIGASSANPTNLVLGGGTLSYTGPAVSINRGYNIQTGGGTIDAQGDLALSGLVTAVAGTAFTKSGAATLSYTAVGSNTLTGSGSDYLIKAGTVVFGGTSGNQTNVIQRRLYVGSIPGVDTAVMLTNTTLNVSGLLELGNSNNATATLTIKSNATLNALGSPMALGDGGGSPSSGVVIHNAGTLNSSGEIWIGQGVSGLGNYTFTSGALNLHNWLAIGRAGGNGTFNMTGGIFNKDGNGNFVTGTGAGNNALAAVGTLNISAGTINNSSEYWLAEGTASIGTNNISGTAVLNLNNWVSIGRGGLGVVNFSGGTINRAGGGSAFIVGDGGAGNAFFNQSGGTLTSANELWVGQGGATGQFNLSAGSVSVNNWVAVGRGGGNGTLNISGGSLTKTGNGGNHFIVGAGGPGTLNQTGGTLTSTLSDSWIGESQTGTWNLSGGAAVMSVVHIAQNSGTLGTLNLNGGSLTATEVTMGNAGGKGTLNFNGGTLVAANGANANFLHDMATNSILAGGAVIDSGTNVISIAQVLRDGGGAGGLTKIGNGALYLNGANTYTGSTLVSTGGLGGAGIIAGPLSVASGATLTPGPAAIGTLTVNNTLSLAAGSKTLVKVSLNGAVTNSDQVVGLTGVTYNGALTVSNVGTNVLTVGAVFQVFNVPGAVSGNFSSVAIWPFGTGTFNPATGQVTITSMVPPTVNPPVSSNGNLILSGTGGTPGGAYTWLTTTNLTNPIAAWTVGVSGVYGITGAFSNAIPINVTESARFYRFRTP